MHKIILEYNYEDMTSNSGRESYTFVFGLISSFHMRKEGAW